MDFSIPDETRIIVETVRRFVETELQPLEREVDETGVLAPETAVAIFRKSKALGLYAMNMPAELGGGGLSAVEMCLVEEQTGQTSDILIRRAFGNVYEVLLVADEAQRRRWLLPSIQGERVFSIAITEPGAGSDAAAIRTRAEPAGEGWRLTGHKHFISDGEVSDFFVVSAVTDPEAGPRGISLFLVDKDTGGVSVGRNQPMMGLRGTSHVELFFDEVLLGPEHLLGERGRGLRLVLETIGRIRLAHIGARAVGMASRLLRLMVEQARTRRQFDRRIGDFQMVQQMLADSAMEINAARLMVLEAAWTLDQGNDARDKISQVKVYAAETYGRVADRAVQLFGGQGYAKDLPIERIYRDSRVARIYDGTSEIHRMVVARALLGEA
ncbi:MAG: acyl-CoA dehydrogenase family protein [Alphaproteobacteria bacterium]|jgi:acyl-CoA dehydrogenase|nr:acyl-CoA dehydrogenase family protein [Alphaproteobacteria bacterium]